MAKGDQQGGQRAKPEDRQRDRQRSERRGHAQGSSNRRARRVTPDQLKKAQQRGHDQYGERVLASDSPMLVASPRAPAPPARLILSVPVCLLPCVRGSGQPKMAESSIPTGVLPIRWVSGHASQGDQEPTQALSPPNASEACTAAARRQAAARPVWRRLPLRRR